MKIVVIDGQGGRMGAALTERLVAALPKERIIAVGTNSIATAAMLKAGAAAGATGENPVAVNSADADIIVGPIGIVMADSLLGEITPGMAVAVARSRAVKVLLPVNRCNHIIVGAAALSAGELIDEAVQRVCELTGRQA